MTKAELLNAELDALFPLARSKQIVTHNGWRYMKPFYPLESSRSGKTVIAWGLTLELKEECNLTNYFTWMSIRGHVAQ